MKGRLRKYSDGWFIEEMVDDNGVKLPQPSRVRVHPEQLTNDDPYRSKYGVDDEVHFEVRTIAMGDSEFNVMDEDVALIIETNEGVNEGVNEKSEGVLPAQPMSQPDGIGVLSSMDIVEPTPTKVKESKMNYKIVSSISADKLSSMVEENMENDWIPQGGLCITGTGLFFQALIKIN
jgi:hypothetical protein